MEKTPNKNIKIEEEVQEESNNETQDKGDHTHRSEKLEIQTSQANLDNSSQINDYENSPKDHQLPQLQLKHSQSQKAKKMPWTEEEDKLVYDLVRQFGPQKWTYIAQHIPGRIGKQCRERWHNHLNPEINKNPWSDEEEWILFLLHRYKGNKWAELCAMLPGRTDNAIKNHWNSSMKKRIPEFFKRLQNMKAKEDLSYVTSEKYIETEKTIVKQLLESDDMENFPTEPEQFLMDFNAQKRRKRHSITPSVQNQIQQKIEDCAVASLGNSKTTEKLEQEEIKSQKELSPLILKDRINNNSSILSNNNNNKSQSQQQDNNKENINLSNNNGKTEKIPQKRGRKPKRPLDKVLQHDHPNIMMGPMHHPQFAHHSHMPPHMQHHPPPYFHPHHPHAHQHYHPHAPHHMHPMHHFPSCNNGCGYNHQSQYGNHHFEWGMQTPQKALKENDGKMVRVLGTNNTMNTQLPSSSGNLEKSRPFYGIHHHMMIPSPSKDGVNNNLNNNLLFQQSGSANNSSSLGNANSNSRSGDNKNINMGLNVPNLNMNGNNNANNNNNNNIFSSPKSFKYESPSKLLDLGTPEHYGSRNNHGNNLSNNQNFLSNSHPRSNAKASHYMNNSGQKMLDLRYLSPCYFTTKHTRNLENSFMKLYESGNKCDIKGVSLFQQQQ